MSLSRLPSLALLCLVVLVVLGVGASATADSDYSLTTAQDIDVPDRTVTFDGNEYEITAISRVRSGTDLTVYASAPSGEQYAVHLYSDDEQIMDSESGTGDATLTFPTGYLDPGSYTLVLKSGGVSKTIQPVVIPAYDTSLEAPSTVTTGEPVNVTVELTQLHSDEPIDRVEAVLGNAETDRRVTLQATDGNTYRANISSDDLPTGEYRLYAVVRGTESSNGHKELLGVSDSYALTIEPESTPTPTATPTPTSTQTSTSGSGSGGSGGGSTGSTGGGGSTGNTGGTATPVTTTSAPTTTPSPTPTPTASTPVPTPTPTSTPAVPTADPTTTTSPSDNVIQPNTPSPTAQSPTTRTSGSPLGAFPLLWVTCCIGLLLYRRHSKS